jgi:hypothetical protein
MAPSKAKKTPASKKPTRKPTTKRTGKAATKPTDKNRISKPVTNKSTYSDKSVEARRAKDAHIIEKFQADMNRQENCSSEASLWVRSTIPEASNLIMRRS